MAGKVHPNTVSGNMLRWMSMLKQIDTALKSMDVAAIKRNWLQLTSQKVGTWLDHPDYQAFDHYKAVKESFDAISSTIKNDGPKFDAWEDISKKFPTAKQIRLDLEKYTSSPQFKSQLTQTIDKFRKIMDYVSTTYGTSGISDWGPIAFYLNQGPSLIAAAEAAIEEEAEKVASEKKEREEEKLKKEEEAKQRAEAQLAEKQRQRQEEDEKRKAAAADPELAARQLAEFQAMRLAVESEPPKPAVDPNNLSCKLYNDFCTQAVLEFGGQAARTCTAATKVDYQHTFELTHARVGDTVTVKDRGTVRKKFTLRESDDGITIWLSKRSM